MGNENDNGVKPEEQSDVGCTSNMRYTIPSKPIRVPLWVKDDGTGLLILNKAQHDSLSSREETEGLDEYQEEWFEFAMPSWGVVNGIRAKIIMTGAVGTGEPFVNLALEDRLLMIHSFRGASFADAEIEKIGDDDVCKNFDDFIGANGIQPSLMSRMIFEIKQRI